MPFDNSPAELPAIDDLDEVGRALIRAADFVDQGWCQGRFGEPGGPRCAVGAILEVTADRLPFGNVRHFAVARLTRFIGCRVQDWNDTKGRTVAEVAAAMRDAARTRS